MAVPAEQTDALQGWLSLAETIEKAIDGLAESDLDLRSGVEGWSIRETVHHLVEANLIASNILIAALANSGCVYDWSWVNPDKSWMHRLGYNEAPTGPALQTLRTLSEHIGDYRKSFGWAAAEGAAPRCSRCQAAHRDSQRSPGGADRARRRPSSHCGGDADGPRALRREPSAECLEFKLQLASFVDGNRRSYESNAA